MAFLTIMLGISIVILFFLILGFLFAMVINYCDQDL